jgi:putative Mg2+ transporter-C (MgtC) family protein
MLLGWGEVALRLGTAAVFGLLVGFERERRARAAGMRTMALVAVGAALFTLIAVYPYADIVTAQHSAAEPSRIIAQIVTGIGFLGAGTIWLRKNLVHGLTTAAALWVVAAVGTACGAGLWVLAAATIVVMLLVLVALRPIESRIFPTATMGVVRVWKTAEPTATSVLTQVEEICRGAGLRVDSLAMRTTPKGMELLELRFVMLPAQRAAQAIEEIRRLPGVEAVRLDSRPMEP